ncbi:hypothetical protein J6590_046046 [Homalodisca vitripennis]|nr:hypothetical protein J6590_046046 [Homalodisca vitripennis]
MYASERRLPVRALYTISLRLEADVMVGLAVKLPVCSQFRLKDGVIGLTVKLRTISAKSKGLFEDIFVEPCGVEFTIQERRMLGELPGLELRARTVRDLLASG